MAFPTPGGLLRRAQTSLEQGIAEHDHNEAIRPSTAWSQAITWTLIGGTVFGLGWLALAQTEEIVVAPGKLEPMGSVKEVQVPLGGVASQILVKEGQRVKKGDVLLQLDTEASGDRARSVKQTILLKQRQLGYKETEYQRYLELNRTEGTSLRDRLRLEQEILKRLTVLGREGAAGELQVLQQRNKVQDLEGKLLENTADGLRQQAVLNQQIQELKGQLSDLNSKLTELNVNLRYQSVRSPVDGIIFDLKPRSIGFVAQGSEPVMKVVPYDKLEARVEIASSDIGFVRVGRPADINIDSFPASDFGVLTGTVRQIGSDALPPTQDNQTLRFPAKIQLSSQQLNLKSGQTLPLQVGMSIQAHIKLRKVSYLQLLLGSFRDKADSIRRI
jgi:HlyD family secretion protein